MESSDLLRIALDVLSDAVWHRPLPQASMAALRAAAPDLTQNALPINELACEIVRRESTALKRVSVNKESG
jgi:hypothetical protein